MYRAYTVFTEVCAAQTPATDVANLYWAAAVCDVASPDALANLVDLGASLEGAPLDEADCARLFQAHMVLQKLGAPCGGKVMPILGETGMLAEAQPVEEARATPSNGRFPGKTPPLQLLPQSMIARGAAAWRAQLAEARETPVSST